MCLGVPALVEQVGDGVATVDVTGARREVCTLLLGDGVAPGDWVLVHVGFAMALIDEDEAHRTLDLLAQAVGALDREGGGATRPERSDRPA